MSGGGISRTISDRFPVDLPRVGMENDLQDWGSALGVLHGTGFIPAHAGKTHNATRVAHLPGDHSQVGWLPPSCVPYHYFEKDSSPLTQGIPVGYGDRVRIPGIIPANAGNTWPTGRTVSTRADHPCLRGEHTV